MQTKLLSFLEGLEDATTGALWRPTVRSSFRKAGIMLGPISNVLKKLHHMPTDYSLPPESKRFTLSGKWISDPKFLQEWKLHDEKKSTQKKTVSEPLSESADGETEQAEDDVSASEGEIEENAVLIEPEDEDDLILLGEEEIETLPRRSRLRAHGVHAYCSPDSRGVDWRFERSYSSSCDDFDSLEESSSWSSSPSRPMKGKRKGKPQKRTVPHWKK
jgi:hypothetical protein